MSYFVRDRETDQRRHLDAGFIREPGNAIGVNRGERPCAGRRVNQRVTELQLAMDRRGPWKLHEPHRQL